MQKIERLIKLYVFEKCRVIVGALQETKWFGNEVYRVRESVLLTACWEFLGLVM